MMGRAFEKAARRFWDQMQEDGENFDFETCHERLKEFVAALNNKEKEYADNDKNSR